MKTRMFTGWTMTRVLYLLAGSALITESVISRQWFGVVFGIYFASMGLFAFGCAAGNCYAEPVASHTNADKEIEFEEIK